MSTKTESPAVAKQTPGERFAKDTSKHQMAVMHDDGLYRHLHFAAPGTSMYWFDLITVPGTLIFQGDGDSFVFSRIDDMFEFFRGPVGRINPGYWSEKLTGTRDRAMRYDEDVFTAKVLEEVATATQEDPSLVELAEAVRLEILESLDISYEDGALQAADGFAFYKDEIDRYGAGTVPDFQFENISEWNCRDYDWWFLWACHAIAWGIAQFDRVKAGT